MKLNKILAGIVLAAAAISVSATDNRETAERFDLVAATVGEPTLVAGSKYTWEEAMQSLIEFNNSRGHEERARYLTIAQKDKAYYFFRG